MKLPGISTIPAALAVLSALLLASCARQQQSPVGVWKCETYGSELILELTDGGDFIDRTGGAINKYRVEGNNIITYVEDEPDSEVSLPFEIRDGVLYLGTVAYEPVTEETELPVQDTDAAEDVPQ